jgi:signal transduction histidine kinase
VKRFLLAPVSKRTALEVLYALISVPLGLACFIYVLVSLSVGVGLTVTLVGLPLIALAVFGARMLGRMQRGMARSLLGFDTDAPPPPRAVSAQGLFARLGAALGDLPAWRAVGYLVFRAPLSAAYAIALVFFVMWGVLGLTYPIWWAVFDPTQLDKNGVRHHAAIQFGTYYVQTWPSALVVSACGAVVLLFMPWVLRALLWVDKLLMSALLGPSRSERRILALEESRSHAVDDSAAELRRIERDLHDGAQAQLVALAMQLGEAKENLEAGPADLDLAETRALIDAAHRNAKQAINELRDLARGIHPPALDNGLADALGTLAARSAVPVAVSVRLRERPSAAIETIAYFCAAELLTNAAKHAAPTRMSVDVGQLDGTLRMTVIDDGRGGARIGLAGGLAGLLDRARTVDGMLTLDSPPGGPTVALVELPLRS